MQLVYFFGEGDTRDKSLLGGKGANLGEMSRIGLPVPPGFTISTEVCRHFIREGKYPDGLEEEINLKLLRLEEKTGKRLGDASTPLLLSVRSGAPVSMPGMMDTVLNLGLNEHTVESLARASKNERFAWDCYRRFIQMFGNVVLGIEHSEFERILEEKKQGKADTDLSPQELKEIVAEYKKLIRTRTGKDMPSDPKVQLKMAIDAVFNSWNNRRAIKYRELHGIPHTMGTAVNVQAMVFGNMGTSSATGVGFTRNPSTGAKEHYGEYLVNAQGEDVVAGIRTPKHIDEMAEELPAAYQELIKVYDILEKHYRDMQDFEFTIENGKLYILQTRTGKRTAQAAVKIAVDMVKEGLITKEEAIQRIEPDQLNQLLHPRLDSSRPEAIAKGLPASPGAAVGKVVFTADDAVDAAEQGESVILVRTETSPEDIHGMAVAKGILTARGGMTSHAAVVARGMGKPCVAGCGAITVNESDRYFKVGEQVVKEGDFITLDGSTGDVILGKVSTIEPEISGEFQELMEWADSFRKMRVRANADTPEDAKKARELGAEGIGLCRTEHMFFEKERLPWMQKMILAKSEQERRNALEKLLPFQKEDFKGIFRAMDGLPVTIRLLDPPLHEFLPREEKEAEELSQTIGIPAEQIMEAARSLQEINPMLGHRGCRLAITYPEIAEMQVRAIFKAAREVLEEGKKPVPEIEVPLVGNVAELREMKKIIQKVAADLSIDRSKIPYKIGTMIEVPRACVTADQIAGEADFFSFGTNDLTQMTLGFSRDDAGKFIQIYRDRGVLERDPFRTLDQKGVGSLMRICIEKARQVKPGLEIGICGEHGGDPESVRFCHKAGLDYVSCSPFRVPIARLAAAQAIITV